MKNKTQPASALEKFNKERGIETLSFKEVKQSIHTQGKWSYHPSGENMRGYSQPYGIAEYNSQNLIAGVFGDTRGGLPVAEENAKRIVKCVNMHDELVQMMKELDDRYRKDYNIGCLSDFDHDRWNKIKNLIRKSEQK